ncbi:MAG TPA: AAA family ATPase [Pirellulales bacterium]|nr:AAA family ATPase [Pirellulales bacterium]
MKNTNPKRQRGRGAKIKELTVKNFTVFDEAKFEFSPGLNVIIGENGTGKSHLLKLMYAIVKGSTNPDHSTQDLAEALVASQHGVLQKLRAVFMPEHGRLERLVRNGARSGASLRLATDGAAVEMSIQPAKQRGLSPIYGFEGSPQFDLATPCVFLPPADVLALYEGFIGSYAKRALSLDETYNDLCIELDVPLLREEPEWAIAMLRRIEKLIGGKVVVKGGRFYIGKLEAHLVAAGYRKLGEIVRLIGNGSITSETVLFWDEPEAGLNPRLITLVSELVFLLAKVGVQVFVATHDFLLSDQLSVAVEYGTEEGKAANARFFGLSRPKPNASVVIESGGVLADIQNNPILAEYAEQSDRERRLFSGESAAAAKRGP